jgi:hypothetical protein
MRIKKTPFFPSEKFGIGTVKDFLF